MSNAVLAACWPLQMPPTQKSVLISLADKADEKGYCWPSIATICERTCFRKTAVIDAIRWLEEAGALKADRTNGRHTTYTITALEFNPSGKRTGTGNKPVRLADATGTANGQDPSGKRTAPVRETDTNHQEPSSNPKSNHQSKRANTAERFDEFWSAYPVKTAKPQCLAKWKSVGLDSRADKILADVAAKRIRDRRWLDGYIPNPHTYLNQERWNDPVQPVVPKGGIYGNPNSSTGHRLSAVERVEQAIREQFENEPDDDFIEPFAQIGYCRTVDADG